MGVIDLADRPKFRAPTPIQPAHRLDGFNSGKEPLDDWLRAHALENEGKASRTFVIADGQQTVQAYYTLATGSVMRTEVPNKYRHGLPNPVPVMVLGRLAVDERFQGKRLGPAMLKEALTRTLRVSQEAGVRAIIVHAIDDDAVNFYAKYRFQVFPRESRTLFLPTETIASSLIEGPRPLQ